MILGEISDTSLDFLLSFQLKHLLCCTLDVSQIYVFGGYCMISFSIFNTVNSSNNITPGRRQSKTLFTIDEQF